MTLVLEAQDLTVEFPIRHGTLTALDHLTISVRTGQRLGIAGGSGSGKTTLARVLVGLQPPTSGTVRADGQELRARDTASWRQLRRRVAMVFQDPNSSLNPRMRIGHIITEPVRRSHTGSLRKMAAEALESVELSAELKTHYPHELSGGQRQRVAIARALISQPEILIADEPVSALDVSVRASVLDLLRVQATERGLGLVLISHDLAVLGYLSQEIAVMRSGSIVEQGETVQVLRNPRHRYTKQLVDATLSLPVHRSNVEPCESTST